MIYPHSIFIDVYQIAPPDNAVGLATLEKSSVAIINAGDEITFGQPVVLPQEVDLSELETFSLEGYILLEGKTRLNIRHQVTLPAGLPTGVAFQIGLSMEDANTGDLVIQEKIDHSPRSWQVPLGDLFPDGLYE
ncbi:hypothetical protein BKI52_20345 [marine bacterium AO1-C]|nr:hypothetical protein BKI52_20345 [marine bacterium AO1-C]